MIEAACEWWARVVCNPRNKTGGAPVVDMLADSNAVPVRQEQRDKFKARLGELIDAAPMPLVLDVNYHPDYRLADALGAAGIPRSNAPIKTTMWIAATGEVRVRYGYGAQVEVLR